MRSCNTLWWISRRRICWADLNVWALTLRSSQRMLKWFWLHWWFCRNRAATGGSDGLRGDADGERQWRLRGGRPRLVGRQCQLGGAARRRRCHACGFLGCQSARGRRPHRLLDHRPRRGDECRAHRPRAGFSAASFLLCRLASSPFLASSQHQFLQVTSISLSFVFTSVWPAETNIAFSIPL